jgi:hypothetical protein
LTGLENANGPGNLRGRPQKTDNQFPAKVTLALSKQSSGKSS